MRRFALVVALAALGMANLDHQLDRTDLLLPSERKMGVLLEDNKVTRVMQGRARDAGWEVGDVIVSINGTAVETRRDVVRELQRGGSRKQVRLQRGEELIESELDYSDDPEEPRRARLRERRAAREQAERDAAQDDVTVVGSASHTELLAARNAAGFASAIEL